MLENKDWRISLRKLFSECFKRGGKVLIIGVGNLMREDDFVGSYIARELLRQFKGRFEGKVMVIDAGPSPENSVSSVHRFEPSLVLFIDAIHAALEPGSIILLNLKGVEYQDVLTHTIPISFLIKVMDPDDKIDFYLLGFQPKKVGFGERMSEEIYRAAKEAIAFLRSILKEQK
ncbi:MAG: hydrogenase maturation protease [Nitrososphaerota archaeon]|nr:hydrogenase maturation protease [Nitrososphaerales archaeon]MDW8044508.1 hydrogenase maturation protease [Nitrososphaerota archaeon]